MTFVKGEPNPGVKFKPGESGNPNGRPEGIRSRATIAKEVLNMEVTLPEDIWEKLKAIYPTLPKKVTAEFAATLAIIHRAVKMGDHQALKALLDSAYGNTKQEIELVGDIKITDHKLTIEVVMPTKQED